MPRNGQFVEFYYIFKHRPTNPLALHRIHILNPSIWDLFCAAYWVRRRLSRSTYILVPISSFQMSSEFTEYFMCINNSPNHIKALFGGHGANQLCLTVVLCQATGFMVTWRLKYLVSSGEAIDDIFEAILVVDGNLHLVRLNKRTYFIFQQQFGSVRSQNEAAKRFQRFSQRAWFFFLCVLSRVKYGRILV